MSTKTKKRYSSYLYLGLICIMIGAVTVVGLGGCSSEGSVETSAVQGTPTPTNQGSTNSGGGLPTQTPSNYYTLTVSASPEGSGIVTSPGSNLVAGTEAILSAIPDTGYSFDYWSGDASGTNSTTTIAMNTNKSVVAHFKSTSIRSITVSPASSNVAMNQGQQFRAMANYSDGSTADVTGSATWSSNNPSTAVVSSGGRATGMFPGTVTITATIGAIRGIATVTVTRY